MGDWIDASVRMPSEGELVVLPDNKNIYTVHGTALYFKDKLACPLCLIEKYKLFEE